MNDDYLDCRGNTKFQQGFLGFQDGLLMDADLEIVESDNPLEVKQHLNDYNFLLEYLLQLFGSAAAYKQPASDGDKVTNWTGNKLYVFLRFNKKSRVDHFVNYIDEIQPF